VAREVHEDRGIEPELKGPAVIAWAPHGGAERLLFSYIGRLTAGQREQVGIDGADIIVAARRWLPLVSANGCSRGWPSAYVPPSRQTAVAGRAISSTTTP
jgi:hypothetical protein